MYKKTVLFISNYISQELQLNDIKTDRIRFGIELLISAMISLFTTLILALFLNIIKPVFIILLIGAWIKSFAGGIHLKKVYQCALFTALTANGLGLILKYNVNLFRVHFWTLLIISFLYIIMSLILWAPMETKMKPFNNLDRKVQFKIISFISVLSIYTFIIINTSYLGFNLIIINCALILGMLLNALTINPLLYKLVEKLR